MNNRVLAMDSGPPLMTVLHSFVIAPWFLVAAGLELLWAGPEAFRDRYTVATLAATHLVTIGFLLLTVTASVFQLVPVLSGIPVPGLAIVAPVVRWGSWVAPCC